MSGESKRRNKKQLYLKEKAIQETINNVLTNIATTREKMRIDEQKQQREELEKILEDMLRLDPREISEYLGDEEFLGAMITALYYIKKIAASRPANPNTKTILIYFRTIDAIAASIIEMIRNAKSIILERTIQIKQAAIMREDPLEELDRLESILILLKGLKKHIKNIIDEVDT